MSTEASALWRDVYAELSADRSGLHGSVTARAEAQCVRLALIYCLFEGADEIRLNHRRNRSAAWQYCDRTATFVFGSSLGDRIADEIMRRLRLAGDGGLTRTEISDAFQATRAGRAHRRGTGTAENPRLGDLQDGAHRRQTVGTGPRNKRNKREKGRPKGLTSLLSLISHPALKRRTGNADTRRCD